jgi:hypothetical protein
MTLVNGRSPAARLKAWHQRSDVSGVRIVSLPPLSSCSVCQVADGTEYSVEDARSAQPLPHEDCKKTRPEGRCCCTYIPLFGD